MSKRREITRSLKAFLGSEEVTDNYLPLVHTMPAFSFRDLFEKDQLLPTECNVLHEDILYLFYGRPAYRTRNTPQASIEFSWPIVLIFDPEKIHAIESIYPFDSGAFILKIYQEFFHPETKIDDFALDGDLSEAERVIKAFYGSKSQYFSGSSTKNLDDGIMNFEAQGVHNLARIAAISDTTSARRDDRSSAIEIRMREGIVIQEAILAAILPEPYLKNKKIVEALDRWDVDHRRYYRIFENTSGELWVGQIYQMVDELYKDLGFLPAEP